MAVKMKVLTLNCWGVPVPVLGAQLRKERMAAIGKELAKAEYDIVLLQEIWAQSDYETLCAKVLTVMPYTHYFHSGVIGSGLCIFSKYAILETQGFPYTVNGYAHKIQHGDWYGRKAVGLAKLLVHDIRVNVYVTHLHAGYGTCNGEYNGHRIAQAFELSQIVKNTSNGCDVVLIGGDFNYCPDEVGYKIIRYNGNLNDAWLSQRRKVEDDAEGTTCDRHDISFSKAACQENKSSGTRLDYLLFRNNAGFTMDCEDCHVTMEKVPGESYNYSDHLGVMAVFNVRRNITATAKSRETGEIEKHLMEALPIVEQGLQKIKSNQVFFIASMFLCLVAVVFTCDIAPSWTVCGIMIGIIRTFLTVAIAFLLWTVLILSKVERAGLTATKKDINNLLKSNPA